MVINKLLRTISVIIKGLSPDMAQEFNIHKHIYNKTSNGFFKKYLLLDDLSGKYANLANNKLTLKYELEDFSEYLLPYYFCITNRQNHYTIMSLQEGNNVNIQNITVTNVLSVLKNKRRLLIVPASCKKNEKSDLLEYKNSNVYLNKNRIDEHALVDHFSKLDDMYLVMGNITKNLLLNKLYGNAKIKLVVLIANEHKGKPEVLGSYLNFRDEYSTFKSKILTNEECREALCGGYIESSAKIPYWEKGISLAKDIGCKFQELEFFGIEFLIGEDNLFLWNILTHPDVPEKFYDNLSFRNFIDRKAKEKQKNLKIKKRVFLTVKYIYSCIAEHFGYMGFMLKNWQRDLVTDWLKTRTTIRDKIWAHKRGFLSFRIKQYGLKNDNLSDFLPDRDYRKLRPINNDCVSWVYDKVVTRYILDKKKNYLPEYYYHLIYRNGRQIIIPLHDCPKEYSNDISGVLKLLKQKKKLILKPSEGSHGKGVFKIECFNDNYIVNDIIVDENVLIDKIESLKGFYNITEYIEMHSVLKKFYDKTTYTIRIMVINEHGVDPWLANAYMRIAATSTGVTDNISDGGICARIDITTGEIFEPEQIINHVIMPCRFHPDTGVEIKGKVPNWELVKDGVLDVSRYIGQLEYLGFDVVVTEDGFKILEINTHQDLHRYPHYDKKIHEYFLRKCEQKQV